MNMQDIIVTIIGILVFGAVAYKMYKILTRKPEPNEKCGGCTGCAMKKKSDCNM